MKLESYGWGPHLEGIRRGARLSVRGPLGQFVFSADPGDLDVLFVAGGTGIAPLRSMIRHVLRTKQGGRMRLLYSARTPSEFAYLPELRRYARDGVLDLSLNVTREVPARWRGERGRITAARLAPLVQSPRTLCYVCGPAAMVDEVPRMLVDLGVPRSQIRIEDW